MNTTNTKNRIRTHATIFNHSEAEERRFLEATIQRIRERLKSVHDSVVSRHQEMMEIKQQLQEHIRDLDHADKANLRQAADMASRVGEHAIDQRRKLERLLNSPYFGRIDCQATESSIARPVYIGVHSLAGDQPTEQLVHDWRAPISSIFYDYELGEASYDSPGGPVHCSVSLKRQYRIDKQQLQFMIESSVNIQDNILQEELSRASDDKLKTIVATIQRDQNAIIRNDRAHTLIIQGAAGSGKTSIALHRVAYLLYKYKESITSDDILIVSPNKVFAHYISQVLPELGEEMIRETTMETLAHELLEEKHKFQTFAEQVSVLLMKPDSEFGERVRFKATLEFVDQLDRYIEHVRSTQFCAAPIKIGLFTIEANWIASQVRKRSRHSVSEQINGLVTAIVEHMHLQHQKSVVGKERTRIRRELRMMFADSNLKAIYKGFYAWIGRPEMLKSAAKGALEYSDVFPLVYLKLHLEGANPRNSVKHVLIDEMQDYTPVQYRVIEHLFPVKKTILGDRNQSVNPLSSTCAESIRDVLPGAECVSMQKSYRSTIEITELAQCILHNPDLIPIERHGQLPQIRPFRSRDAELDFVRASAKSFADSPFHSLGIICKTQNQADAVYEQLRGEVDVRLIDAASKTFSNGILISTAYLAKGLEFDQVVIPFCNDREYRTSIDRHMLYVAVTRAMHMLVVTYSTHASPLLASVPRRYHVQ